MSLLNYKFGLTLRYPLGHAQEGQIYSGCPSVELHKGVVVVELDELGTTGYYLAQTVPAGRYQLYVNAVDTGMSFPVGAGEVAGLGYESGKVLGSLANALAWVDQGGAIGAFVPIDGSIPMTGALTFEIPGDTGGSWAVNITSADGTSEIHLSADGLDGKRGASADWWWIEPTQIGLNSALNEHLYLQAGNGLQIHSLTGYIGLNGSGSSKSLYMANDVDGYTASLNTGSGPFAPYLNLHDGANGATLDTTDLQFNGVSIFTSMDGKVTAHIGGIDPHGDRAFSIQRGNHTGTQLANTISDFATSSNTLIDAKISSHVGLSDPHTQYILESREGVAYGVATLDSSGKILTSQLPALAITDTFVVASQTAMLALTAEVGDVAVRTDLSKSYILKTAGASVLANWQELLTPTGYVTYVFGRSTSAIVATTGDYSFSQISGSVAATQMPAFTGDITTTAGAVATTIGTNKVTLAKMAQVATGTFLGRTTASTGNVEALTVAQAKSLLAITKSDVGLSAVENTALSTWTGNTAIISIGTLTTGTVPWARLSSVPANLTSLGGLTFTSSSFVKMTATGTFSLDTTSYQPFIGAGGAAQYWRGDKTWQTLDSSAVGLGNVQNIALTSWSGSINITNIGTLVNGTVPWARLSNVPATYAPSAHTHASLDHSLSVALNVNSNQIASASATAFSVVMDFDVAGSTTLQAASMSYATIGTKATIAGRCYIQDWTGSTTGNEYGAIYGSGVSDSSFNPSIIIKQSGTDTYLIARGASGSIHLTHTDMSTNFYERVLATATGVKLFGGAIGTQVEKFRVDNTGIAFFNIAGTVGQQTPGAAGTSASAYTAVTFSATWSSETTKANAMSTAIADLVTKLNALVSSYNTTRAGLRNYGLMV
jgi:hypothetical protein